MSAPFFSVIIPIYKVEPFVEQCVESVLSQTCEDYEIILVDDGSPDRCGEICDEFASQFQRVRVLHKKNEGLSMARNDGLKLARGKYVVFLDSDDYWDDNTFLFQALNKLNENCNIDILLFGSKKLLPSNRFTDYRKPHESNGEKPNIRSLMESNTYVVCAWDKIVLREYLIGNDICFTKGQMSEDFEWCIKLMEYNPMIEVIGCSPHVYRKQNANSITANIKRKNLEDICDVINKYKDQIENEPLMHFLAEEYVLWMIPSNIIDKGEIKDLLSSMKSNIWLLSYTWYPKVKVVSKLRPLGFEFIRKSLFLAYRIKRIM